VAGGGIVLASMLLGAIRFDPTAMAAAVATLLGGTGTFLCALESDGNDSGRFLVANGVGVIVR
jgi:hypothetical protein